MLERLEPKLASTEKRYDELEQIMAQPEVATNHARLQALAQEQSEIKDVVDLYLQYNTISKIL